MSAYETIDVEITEEEKTTLVTNFAKSYLEPTSFGLFEDLLNDGVEVDTALGRAIFNNIIINSLQTFIEDFQDDIDYEKIGC